MKGFSSRNQISTLFRNGDDNIGVISEGRHSNGQEGGSKLFLLTDLFGVVSNELSVLSYGQLSFARIGQWQWQRHRDHCQMEAQTLFDTHLATFDLFYLHWIRTYGLSVLTEKLNDPRRAGIATIAATVSAVMTTLAVRDSLGRKETQNAAMHVTRSQSKSQS